MRLALQIAFVVIASSLLLAGGRSSAYGEPNWDPLANPASAEARKHLALGNKLYGVRNFAEAISEYKAGTLVESVPVFDYNLGQAFRQLGEYKEAIWHYERFLSRGNPQGPLLDAVNNFIVQMKAELSKKAMTEKPVEPAPVPASPTVAVPASSTQSQTRAAPAQIREVPGPWYRDIVGMSLAGAGLVGVGIGSALLINARSINDQANSTPGQLQYNRLHDKANSRNLAGLVTGGVGLGILVAGVFKLALHKREPSTAITGDFGASHGSLTLLSKF